MTSMRHKCDPHCIDLLARLGESDLRPGAALLEYDWGGREKNMKRFTRVTTIVLSVAVVLTAFGCGGGGVISPPPGHLSTWTWVSGAKALDQVGVYGTEGTASPSNVPGGRQAAVSWRDSSGHFWLFGGFGIDSAGTQHDLNDLWKFDGTNWTWISGSNLVDQTGVYGTKGVASPSNVPGARDGSVSWIDKSNNLWLFGGSGRLSDLWKFDGTSWTWVNGSNLNQQAGVYGTKGIASPANAPGARTNSVSWIDSSGNPWLFGGFGSDSVGAQGELNDLWKFDGTNWTWVSGSNVISQPGVYGTKAMPSSSNVPGSRFTAISWIDKTGNLWLFGGNGTDSTGAQGNLNDLWKFNGTNWTWVSGSNGISQPGVYGTKGTPSSSNVPGVRNSAVSWIDNGDNLWLFAGTGNDSTGTLSLLNDIWKFDGTNWIWMGGSQIGNGAGAYGTLGTASASNVAASRVNAVSWIDASGSLWFFGGFGEDPAGMNASGNLNDLWRFTP
jgi:N-acetylneuraminic acid mutarotase